MNLHTEKISNYSSIIAKQKKIRIILKDFQKKYQNPITGSQKMGNFENNFLLYGRGEFLEKSLTRRMILNKTF